MKKTHRPKWSDLPIFIPICIGLCEVWIGSAKNVKVGKWGDIISCRKNARIAWGGRAVFQNTAVGQTYYDQINI